MGVGSTFSGLSIVQQGMAANRLAAEVLAHNLANQTNPSYSRQIPILEATNPFGLPLTGATTGILGTGARLAAVHRVRSEFVDNQIRKNSMDLSAWQMVQTTMQKVAGTLDANSAAITQKIAEFADSWDDLARVLSPDVLLNPATAVQTTLDVADGTLWAVNDVITVGGVEDMKITNITGNTLTVVRAQNGTAAVAHAAAETVVMSLSEDSARASVRATGTKLAEQLRSAWNDLDGLMVEADKQIQDLVSQANGVLQGIADLNRRISQALTAGQAPNDLMDQRDQLVEQLSGVMDFNMRKLSDGSYLLITSGGQTLVAGNQASTLDSRVVYGENGRFLDVGLNRKDGTRANISPEIQGGALGGLLQVRNLNLPFYLSKVNETARSLIDQVNALHHAGYAKDGVTTGLNFFLGQDARDITVNFVITPGDNNAMIAASSVRFPAPALNGEIAAMLGNLSRIVMNERKESRVARNGFGPAINPSAAIVTQAWTVAPTANGVVRLTGLPGGAPVTVAWNNGQSIFTILANINAGLRAGGMRNTHAVFDEQQQKFYVLGDESVLMQDVSGNLTGWTDLRTMERSAGAIAERVDFWVGRLDPAIPLNSQLAKLKRDGILDSQGVFEITGVDANGTPFSANVAWNDGMTMNQIVAAINSAPVFGTTLVSAVYDLNAGQLRLVATVPDRAVRIADVTGNFAQFAKLANSSRFQPYSDSLPVESAADAATADSQVSYLSDAQTQLEAQRSAISSVSADAELAELLKFEKAYNAMVQVLSVFDSMMNTLINRMAAGQSSIDWGN